MRPTPSEGHNTHKTVRGTQVCLKTRVDPPLSDHSDVAVDANSAACASKPDQVRVGLFHEDKRARKT